MNEQESPDARDAGSRGGRLRRVLRLALRTLVVGALLVIVLLALAWLGRNRVVAPAVLRALGPTLERTAGLSVSVGEVSGGWLEDLALADVRVAATGEDGVLRTLSLDEARVAYDLRRLVRGDLEGLLSVEAHGVRAELDLTRAAPGGEETEDGAGAAIELPERLPSVALDGEVTVVLDAERTIVAEIVELTAAPPVDGAADGSPLALEARVLGTPVEVDGRWLPGARVEARVEVPDADLGRLAGELASELAPAIGGTVALAVDAELAVLSPADVRARFELDGAGLRWERTTLERVDAAGSYEAGVLKLDELSAEAGANRVHAGSLTLPLAALSAPDDPGTPGGIAERLAAVRARVEVELHDVPGLLGLERDDVPEHEVRLALSMTGDAIDLERGRVETAGGNLVVRSGRLPLEDGRELDVELDVDFDDLSAVGTLLGSEGWSGRVGGELVLRGTWSAPRGSATLRADRVELAGNELGNLALQADVDADALHVGSLAADGAFGHVDLAGILTFATRALDVEASLAIDDRWIAPAGLAGPLEAALDVGGTLDEIAVGLYAETPELEATVRGTVAVDLARGRYDARLDRLALEDGCCGVELLEPARVSWDAGIARVERLVLGGGAGFLSATATYAPGLTCAEVELVDFAPPPLLRAWLPGEIDLDAADADVSLELDASTLAADVQLALAGLRGPTFGPLEVKVDATLGGGTVEVRELVARAEGDLSLELAGAAPFDPRGDELLPDGPVRWTGRVEVPDALALPGVAPDGPLRSGRLDAELDLGGTWSAVTGSIDVHARDVVVPALELPPDRTGPELQAFELDASVELADEVRVREGRISGPGGIRATLDGRLGTPLDVKGWLAEGFDARRSSALELALEANVDDLSRFARLSPALRTLEGAVELGVSIEGTLGDAHTTGRLSLKDGALRTNTALPAIGELDAELALEQGAFRIDRIAGEMGGAPFRLDGEIRLLQSPEGDADAASAEPTLALHLVGEDLLLYRKGGVRVRATTDLHIEGPLSSPLVRGEVGLRDGRYVQDFELLAFGGSRPTPQGRRGLQIFSLRDAPYADLRFDVAVTSETPFRIDTNLTQGTVRPEIQLRGTGAVPLVEGTIYVDPTTVKLPSGKLRVRAGTVVFDEADPFLPTLDVRAESRLRGYDIYVHVSGTYDEPAIDLTSSPSLPQDELLLLLLTGTPPSSQGRTRDDYKQGAQDVLFYIVRDLFGTIGDDDEDSWAERIEITTGGEITRNGSQTTKGTVRLFDDVLTSDDSVFVIGELDVYDKVNFGLQLLFRLP